MHVPKLWQHSPVSRDAAQQLESQLRVSSFLANLLVQRGIDCSGDAESFLNPALRGLTDPLLLTNVEQAGNRILHAIRENEKIHILGDYDVDGVTSTTLLVGFLKRCGSLPNFVVPRRLEEGYGMSRQVIERSISNETPDLFIALDCGTNSVSEVAHLRSLGIDVIIIDHHQSTQSTPADCILVNPHIHDADDNPCRDLCMSVSCSSLYTALSKYYATKAMRKPTRLN